MFGYIKGSIGHIYKNKRVLVHKVCIRSKEGYHYYRCSDIPYYYYGYKYNKIDSVRQKRMIMNKNIII